MDDLDKIKSYQHFFRSLADLYLSLAEKTFQAQNKMIFIKTKYCKFQETEIENYFEFQKRTNNIIRNIKNEANNILEYADSLEVFIKND